MQGWSEPYIYGVYTVNLAGKSQNIRLVIYGVYIYRSGQPYLIYTMYMIGSGQPCSCITALNDFLMEVFRSLLLQKAYAKKGTHQRINGSVSGTVASKGSCKERDTPTH